MLVQQATIRRGQQTIAATGAARESGVSFACKRCMDVALAALALVVLSPLLLLIAILIKLDGPGPLIFAQERVGARRRSRGGRTTWEIRTFRVYKFRTMVHNADQSLHQAYVKAFVDGRLAAADVTGATFKLTNDPRVTRVGRILRRTSLDELPQLVNVLKGDMSLVGPRPVPTYEVAEYQPWHRERLAALPGITGLWQVSARCQVSFEDMIRLDIEYVRNWSLWRDVRILLLTIPAVLSGRGAG
jgi:lipopolysaccharide/colanic/teichoic acid biosynthesis glycosyltransferase